MKKIGEASATRGARASAHGRHPDADFASATMMKALLRGGNAAFRARLAADCLTSAEQAAEVLNVVQPSLGLSHNFALGCQSSRAGPRKAHAPGCQYKSKSEGNTKADFCAEPAPVLTFRAAAALRKAANLTVVS